MAKIDKLITMMIQRNIQCAMLIADKPSRIFASGQESAGPAIDSVRLSEIIAEVTPAEFREQWEQHAQFLFPYTGEEGTFDIGVRYEGETLQVTIARHVDATVESTSRRRSTLAVPGELSEGDAAVNTVKRVGVQKPRLSPLSQIVGLSLLATLIGFGLIILVLRAAAPLTDSQLSVIRVFAVLWTITATVWAVGCFRVATRRAELESLLPPGYTLTPAQKLDQALAKVPDFEITQQFIEPSRHSAIALDENAKRICFITIPTVAYHESYLKRAREVMQAYRVEHNVKYVAPEKIHVRTCTHFTGYDPETDTRRGVYPFRAILESRLLEDGNTLFKTARTSPVGSALIDSLMTSRAGNIVDQSIVDASNQLQYKTIDLRILTNDQNEPVHLLHFLHVPTRDADPVYRTAMRQAEHCHTFMSDLINSLDAEDKAAELQQQREMQSEFLKRAAVAADGSLPPSIAAFASEVDAQSSVVDELQKLVDLRAHAAITQEEFDALKAKLLASQAN